MNNHNCKYCNEILDFASPTKENEAHFLDGEYICINCAYGIGRINCDECGKELDIEDSIETVDYDIVCTTCSIFPNYTQGFKIKEESKVEIGIKYDNNKLRLDLIPPETIEEAAKILTFGSKKYGDWNWSKVENGENRYYAALLRHLFEHKKGNKYDDETRELHLSHVLTNAIFLLYYELKEVNKYEY